MAESAESYGILTNMASRLHFHRAVENREISRLEYKGRGYDMENQITNTPTPVPATSKPKSSTSSRSVLLFPALAIVLGVAALVALAYFRGEARQYQQQTADEMKKISGQLQAFESRSAANEQRLTEMETQLSQALRSVGATHQDLVKKTRQVQMEARRAQAELQSALGSKADAAQVEALKQEANSKFDNVSSEVGGVKNDVGVVKTDLATTRRDLDGTQRQLMDVRETLTAAVAKNSSELALLRAKGERDYYEFTIPKKNVLTKVGDIQLVLTKTDQKKSKFNVKIVADDNQLEKKDRTINEPVQFLVGPSLVRYELVVNWVQKDRVGGYLSVPKDKSLAAERVRTASSF